VLFDEIDELLRTRENGESNPFSRFLTTSMLPKMARLWEQRRVLFFVATNHLEETDSAIKRSQRFDALLFVPPPSFDTKVRELAKVKPPITIAADVLSIDKVETGLTKERGVGEFDMGYFAMLRFEQVREL